MFFIWQQQENEEHIARHGIETFDAEHVIRHARRPYPRRISGDKWLVKGRTIGGRLIQVIYVMRKAEDIDPTLLSPADRLALEAGEKAVYVVHARPLRRGER